MVKYCQRCGNPSYDGATICGNCGAELPPKSDFNSQPPSFEDMGSEKKSDFNFSKGVDELKNLSKKRKENNREPLGNTKPTITKIENFKASRKPALSEEDKRERLIQSTYSSGGIVGFKEKSRGSKDPARKFQRNPRNEQRNAYPNTRREPIREHRPREDKPNNELEFPNINRFKINKKGIALIAIVVIILIAIVGVSVMSMSNTNSDSETLYFSDEDIGFYYPETWKMYENSDDLANGEIAFKTQDKILIGYTKVVNGELTLDIITSSINATAQSLGGNIVQINTIIIDGKNATDITTSSTDHGYSRYISIIHNGVYYSFVINNGQTDNPNDMNSLRSTDIQNMISSIKFSDRSNGENTQV
ncbi:MAG: zinc ribbon domain-containing protein [Methanobacteriaceae archaeon]|nr:zinc ribbon domain-containing protein [Methanobacteriaceae archaeon]